MKTSEVRIESRDGTSYGTKVTIDGMERHDISGLLLELNSHRELNRITVTLEPIPATVEGQYEVGLSGASQAWLKSLGWTAPDEA